jgi:centromere protein I
MPLPLERFLSKYLQDRSRHCSKTILDLLCFLPIRQFESVHRDYLAFVEARIIDSTPQSRVVLLYFYSSLLSHWTNLVLSNSLQDSSEVLAQGCISRLIEHASTLALSMLETSPNDSEDAVLSCLTKQAHLVLHASSTPAIRISLPPPHLIYLLAFTSNLSTISQLCSILTMYKDAFQATRVASMERSSEITWYPLADVTAFNRCIMDLCNLLWRNKALDCEDANAIGCLVPANLHQPMQVYLEGLQENLSLATLFSLSHNSAFAAASAACLREMEDKDDAVRPGELRKRLAGPASHKGLTALKQQGGLSLSWQNYRLEMLQWLDDRGSEGVGSLMRSTMKILKRNES